MATFGRSRAPESLVPAVIGAIETLAAVHPAGAEDRALRLAAAAVHVREEIGYRLELPVIRRRLDQLLVDARASLGAGFETAWTEGAALTWEEAAAYAQRMRGERRRPTHGWDTSHVHHICNKLGISTRSELAATASRRAS